jgi:hypothetical protein
LIATSSNSFFTSTGEDMFSSGCLSSEACGAHLQNIFYQHHASTDDIAPTSQNTIVTLEALDS